MIGIDLKVLAEQKRLKQLLNGKKKEGLEPTYGPGRSLVKMLIDGRLLRILDPRLNVKIWSFWVFHTTTLGIMLWEYLKDLLIPTEMAFPILKSWN